MTTDEIRYRLSKLKNRYLVLRLSEILLLAAATFLLTDALAGLWVSPSTQKILLSALAGLSVFTLRFLHYKLHHLDISFFIRYLNEKYPALKQSADLLMHEDVDLTNLERLQKGKTFQQFNSLYPDIKLPHQIRQSLGIFAVCVLAYFALSAFATPMHQVMGEKVLESKEIKPVPGDPAAVFISALSISITPPTYTQLTSYTANDFNLSIPEGSQVKWLAAFSGEVLSPKIIFSGRDSSALVQKEKSQYSNEGVLNESGFYQLQWIDKNKTYRSDYYKIEVTKDQAPKISIDNLSQFTKLTIRDNLYVEVKSSLGDDYG